MKLWSVLGMLLFPVFAGQDALNGQGRFTSAERQVTASSFSDDLSRSFYGDNVALAEQVDSIYQLMSLEERAAQMIMVSSSSSSAEFSKAKNAVTSQSAGSVLLLKGTKEGFKRQVASFSSINPSVLPPFFACDCEPSLLHRKWDGAPVFLPAMEQETNELIVNTTSDIADEMIEMGAALNFAPVVDNGSNRAIIGSRAFGTTTAEIFPKAGLFINTLQNKGVGATIKHFPGHGAVKGDSHKAAVYIDGPLSELEAFRRTLDNSHPLAVMVGHITVRKNELYGTSGLPSSLSRKIITGLLRQELGFDGIIATDAMNMKAVTRFADADWKAVQAGADLIVMPMNAGKLNDRIVSALQAEDALKDQLEQSIKRIIRFKLVTGGSMV